MYKLPPGETGPPSMLQVFQQDLIRAYLWVLRQLNAFVNWTFDITQHGAQRRRSTILFTAALIWTLLALVTQPLPWQMWRTAPLTLLLEIAQAFIAAGVIRHMLMLALSFWLAFRLAAVYLDDIFELSDVSVAERFIRQAAFADQYNWIIIRDGDVAAENKNSPIFRIGGPGKVLIHLENVALFEKLNGRPHIIAPRSGDTTLESFERLRQVIDLRNQVAEMTVKGRSRDGIHVTAKDVRLIFSVHRGEAGQNGGGDFSQPFSFTDEAIHNLVYRQNHGRWTREMRKLIREYLRRFIAQHTLSAFLATVSPYEELQSPAPADASGRTGTGRLRPETRAVPTEPAVGAGFVTRDEISSLFYDFTQTFSREAASLGGQLEWIGLGTWITPSEIIPEQHLEAWQLSFKNHLLGNEQALREVRRESRTKELLRLIREVPLTTFGRLQAEGRPPEEMIKELLLTYREKLRNAWEIYQNSERTAPPELEASLRHLTRLTARWLD